MFFTQWINEVKMDGTVGFYLSRDLLGGCDRGRVYYMGRETEVAVEMF